MDDVRRELYDGFIKLMTPAPNRRHQDISLHIERVFVNFLYKKVCKIYHAPFDVRFPKERNKKENKQTFTVVQPDICIICDTSKLDEKGCLGAPDMVIEIISPKNSKRDLKDKFEIYQENGVREYWIVQPNDETVTVFILNELNKYQLVGIFSEDDKIPVNIFNGDLEIDLTDIFDN